MSARRAAMLRRDAALRCLAYDHALAELSIDALEVYLDHLLERHDGVEERAQLWIAELGHRCLLAHLRYAVRPHAPCERRHPPRRPENLLRVLGHVALCERLEASGGLSCAALCNLCVDLLNIELSDEREELLEVEGTERLVFHRGAAAAATAAAAAA